MNIKESIRVLGEKLDKECQELLKSLKDELKVIDRESLNESDPYKLNYIYAKKAIAIKASINSVIFKIDEVINLISAESNVKNETQLENIKLGLKTAKNQFEELLDYNATIKENNLSIDDFAMFQMEYYNIIHKNNADLNKVNENLNNNSAETLEEQKIKEQNLLNLIEKAEKSDLYKDFIEAIWYAKFDVKLGEKLQVEYYARLDKITERNYKMFIYLLQKAEKSIENNELLDEEELLKLKDKYQFLKKDKVSFFENRLKQVINIYNIEYQQSIKEKYDNKNERKYTFYEKVTEFLGKPVTWIAGTKVVSKINKKNLEKEQAKLADASSKEKCKIEQKINRIKETIEGQDIASGVRLYSARNYIRKIKPKLYANKNLTNYEAMKLKHSKQQIIKKLSKKLNKVIIKEDVKINKDRIINALDNYVELLALCDYNYFDDTSYNQELDNAIKFLDSSASILAKEEYYAYSNQIELINNYRLATNGQIYELSKKNIDENVSYEVDKILMYSDLDVYYYKNDCLHVLRK